MEERLENRFKLSLARWFQIKNYSMALERFLKEKKIKFIFLKGYSLARSVYNNPALREMADVDIYIDINDRQDMREFLLDKGFSLVKKEKGPAAKEIWIKLLGSYDVCFELHGNIYTDFSGSSAVIPDSFFRDFSETSPEALFLSVLLHHPYYYCRLRDYVDLYLIQVKMKPDMEIIKSYCRKAGLLNHYMRSMAYLDYLREGKRTKWFYSPVLLIRQLSLIGRGNYSLFSRISDGFFHFFIYDSLLIGIKCFYFRYGRFFHKR